MSKAVELAEAAMEAAKSAYKAALEEDFERRQEVIRPDSFYNAGDGMEHVFTYHGFHFCPMGVFPKGCDSLKDCNQHLRSKVEPRMSDYEWARFPYSNDDFYRAAGSFGMSYQVFYCLETGGMYIPGEHELFGYFGGFRRI